jgi:aspartate racemase
MSAASSDARRVVGVLGGMGPAASAHFCLRIAQSTVALRDQDHLHVILDSDPSVPDRSAFLVDHGPDPVPSLVAMARRLVVAGADLLVMSCNSAAPFTSRVKEVVPAEFVDWIGEAVDVLIETHPERAKVGLLATEGTSYAAIYQERLAERDATTILPDPEIQKLVSDAIYGVKAGTPRLTEHREGVLAAAHWLVNNGSDILLVACTEISLLFSSHSADWPAPMVDTLDAVAARTVLRAGAELHPQNPYT